MHGAHVADLVDGVGIEPDIIEEPFHVGHHVVEFTRESGDAVLLHLHRFKVFDQLQCPHCDTKAQVISVS